jgi:hypothetical protein
LVIEAVDKPTSSANRRRFLFGALSFVIMVGVTAALVVLVGTWAPSERATRRVADLTVRDLGRGQVQQFDGKYSRLYVLRTEDNVARAFIFPLRNGRIGLRTRIV